ncbi:Aminoacyl tRNA synthase complex-interacting multifunctional protein 1 [Bulinus truncatus]|nr:Aminoacyl tRNA synthase complex-interacting multifunctional protein 1 [Bulinus truncatus]
MLIKFTRKLLLHSHSISSFSKSISVDKLVFLLGGNYSHLRLQNLTMASDADFERIKAKAELAEKILADLQNQIDAIKRAALKSAGLEEEKQLIKENEALRKEIESVKTALFLAEVGNGVRQVQLPTKAALAAFSAPKLAAPTAVNIVSEANKESNSTNLKQQKNQKAEEPIKKTKEPDIGEVSVNKKAKTDKTVKTEGDKNAVGSSSKKKAAAGGDVDSSDAAVDVSKLDLRIGKIVSVEKHPDADSLYVEKVDLGEGHLRTVVSGLVKHVPINAMKDRIAVFMCNLKPAKMRGVLSEGMIMCAAGAEKTEILVPPTDSVIGDRITCDEYPGTPDAQLNPKKKIWETLKPDIRTNADRVATYKGAPLLIKGKGFVVAPTLANTQIS